ncbi:MAG TPA: tetratricopeptide repeat protein [Nostocaceae cyanobacterium]|nr:tetratricopeptide repeat protein [Nostocaceae cyanobacterium]
MDISTNAAVSQANAQTYINLLVSLEAGVGILQILIAVCDADRQREEIIARYEKELAPAIKTYRVNLDPQEPSIGQAIAQQVASTENAVVTVLGAETLGFKDKDQFLNKFFGYLQWTREALRELKMPIVLWVSFQILPQLAKQAPDFWSWRNGVFQFQLEPSLLTSESGMMQYRDVLGDDPPSSVLTVEQLEASLAAALQQWGADSSKVATLYSQLGKLYAERVKAGQSADRKRELALAEEYLKKAIDLQTKFQQEETLANTLNDLALLYYFQGKYSDAELLLLQSLEIRKRQLGADHPDVATSLNNLAGLYESQGKYSDAEPLYLQSLEIWKHQLGADHPNIASSLNNLAALYYSQRKYSDAEPLYLQSLEILKRQLGADHPNVATSFNNLAGLYRTQRKYSDAEFLYLQSLEIRKRQLGADHPDVAQSLNDLALLYIAQDKYQEAEELSSQALAIYQTALGKQHSNTQNAKLTVKTLYIQKLLQCNTKTLLNILQTLAQQTELPELNTEVALAMLEKLESNPELLSHYREALHSDTEASDDDT